MPRVPLGSEDITRAISYLIGAIWAVVFYIHPPSSYSSVIDTSLVHGWLALAFAGCVVALIGCLTRRDLKVELSGLWILQASGLIYFVAQFGFFNNASPGEPLDRLAFAVYILWHSSLIWPRIVGLEVFRRKIRQERKDFA